MLKYHLLAADPDLLELNESGMAVVNVQGKNLCVAKFRDEWYAFAAKCPHASGQMHHGFIDAMGHVVCPLHRYRFDIRNGRNTSGEGYFLKTYKLEKRGQALYVGIESFGFLGL